MSFDSCSNTISSNHTVPVTFGSIPRYILKYLVFSANPPILPTVYMVQSCVPPVDINFFSDSDGYQPIKSIPALYCMILTLMPSEVEIPEFFIHADSSYSLWKPILINVDKIYCSEELPVTFALVSPLCSSVLSSTNPPDFIFHIPNSKP